MKKLLTSILIIFSNSLYSQNFEFLAQLEGSCNSVEIAGNCIFYNSGPNINIMEINDLNEISWVNTFHSGFYSYPADLNFANNKIIISSQSDGFYIYDVTDPQNPEFLNHVGWPTCLWATESFVADSILIINEYTHESVSLFNIANPTQTTFQSRIDFPINSNHAYAVEGKFIYGFEMETSTNYDHYLKAYDIKNPASPVLSKKYKLCSMSQGPKADAMTVSNNYLFVAFDDTIKIFDVSPDDTILYHNKFSVPYEAKKLRIEGDTLFAYCEDHGIFLVDISNLNNPVITGNYSQNSIIRNFRTKDNILLTAMEDKGFDVLEISDPSNPSMLFQDQQTDNVRSIEINHNLAYMGMVESGIQIIDISDPFNPVDLGNIDSLKWIRRIKFYENCLYCTQGNDYHKIHIIDVSDPMSPVKVNELYSDLFLGDFKFENNLLYLFEADSLKIYDLTNPQIPDEIACIEVSGHRMAIYETLLVVTDIIQGAPSQSVLRTYKIHPDYSLTMCDEFILGQYLAYNPREIEINYPYIIIGASSGAVVTVVDEQYQISLCDYIITGGLSASTNAMTSDETYIYLGGHYGGTDSFWIIDYTDPYDLRLTKNIHMYCLDFAKTQDMVYTANSQLGYSIFGDFMVDVSEHSGEMSTEMVIYPNPASKTATITFNNMPFAEDAQLFIYNESGQILQQINISGHGSLVIDTEEYNRGVYIINLKTKNLSISKKLIIIN